MRISGAGNRFLLLDGILGALPSDPAAFAREACGEQADDSRDVFVPDGVLLLDRDPHGDLRMVIHNADGTRPEACGNGLRCGVRIRRDAEDSPVVEVGLGRATRLGEHLLELPGESTTEQVQAVAVQLGNPHLVLWRDTLDDREVEQWGASLERDARFEGGTNVEFVVPAGSGLCVRVWERGVGETAACGTGAGAAAIAAAWGGSAGFPITVSLPGGELRVDRSPPEPGTSEGELWLAGPVSARGAL